MEKQLDIFSEEINRPLKTEVNLTPRQWKLYEFLKLNNGKTFGKQENMLVEYENWLVRECLSSTLYSYHYFEEKRAGKHYSDMTSGRQLRKDLNELKKDETIQKVIIGNKIANTEEEARKGLEKQKVKALRELKLYWTQVKKLEKNLQQRIVFGKERDHIEALLPLENEKEKE